MQCPDFCRWTEGLDLCGFSPTRKQTRYYQPPPPDEQKEEMTQEPDDILRAVVMKDCGVTMILSLASRRRWSWQGTIQGFEEQVRRHRKDDENDWRWEDKDMMMEILYSPTQCICCWGRRRRSWCRTCDPGTLPRRICPEGNLNG